MNHAANMFQEDIFSLHLTNLRTNAEQILVYHLSFTDPEKWCSLPKPINVFPLVPPHLLKRIKAWMSISGTEPRSKARKQGKVRREDRTSPLLNEPFCFFGDFAVKKGCSSFVFAVMRARAEKDVRGENDGNPSEESQTVVFRVVQSISWIGWVYVSSLHKVQD